MRVRMADVLKKQSSKHIFNLNFYLVKCNEFFNSLGKRSDYCSYCGLRNEPSALAMQWIICGACNRYYHKKCLNFDDTYESDNFKCILCQDD